MKKTNGTSTGYDFDSSVIKSALYNHAKGTLKIEFVKGQVYEYQDVEFAVFNEFSEAGSQGTYFAENIKEAYTFNKL